MNIINLEHINKIYGEKVIFEDASFGIQERDKIGIVGINGTGKSTLLKVIAGEEVPDSGQVIRQNGLKLAFVPQNPVFPDGADIRSYALESGTDESWQVESNLTELGITDFDQKIEQLSGGQKRRVVLAKILAGHFDVLLLDEPTNHLDQEMITWLEEYLRSYRGTVLMVTHDRYFLDKIVTKVVELDNGKATVYLGNYSAYSEKRAQMRAIQMKAYLNQQQEIKHQEEVIEKLKSFNREKSIKRAESREKMLNKIEVLEKPTEINDAMDIRLEPNILSGNDVLTVRDLEKSFGAQHLFSHVDFDVKRGERVAIIGDNGTGKTTILKMINGLVTPDHGEITLGSRVHIGYYDQDHQVLHMDKTLFEEISDAIQHEQHPDPQHPGLLPVYRRRRL